METARLSCHPFFLGLLWKLPYWPPCLSSLALTVPSPQVAKGIFLKNKNYIISLPCIKLFSGSSWKQNETQVSCPGLESSAPHGPCLSTASSPTPFDFLPMLPPLPLWVLCTSRSLCLALLPLFPCGWPPFSFGPRLLHCCFRRPSSTLILDSPSGLPHYGGMLSALFSVECSLPRKPFNTMWLLSKGSSNGGRLLSMFLGLFQRSTGWSLGRWF